MLWDVVVAGAGPAGAVTALDLAKSGRRVLLIDPIDERVDEGQNRRKIGESLPGAARPLLRDLGVLARIERGPHLPSSGNLSSWGSNSLVATDFIRDPHGLGWHLDRVRFDADLRRAAREAGAAWRTARVRSVTASESGWRLGFKGAGLGDDLEEGADDEIEARFLVDATGRAATLARGLGAERRRDDSLVAICAWVATSSADQDSRTLVEATPDGWWYTALLPGQTRGMVLHVDGERAASILRTPGAWDDLLAGTVHISRVVDAAVVDAAARVSILEGPHATEASGARLDPSVGLGWLAVGDAALSFDPLASQGLLNALYTGLRAGQAIDSALDGDSEPVQAYAARLDSIREAYLHHRRTFYQSERRWRDRAFWSRRQS